VPPEVGIRPYRLDDAGPLADAVRESVVELQPWMPWCHPDYSLEESRSWLELQVPAFQRRAELEFAIVAPYGRLLGGCGLNHLDPLNRRANLGYWVRSSESRRGVATAAVRLLRAWAFASTDLVRLEVVIASGNAASHRVAEKAGATREGTLRSRLLLHGVAHDATMFSFVRGPQGPRGPSD
jgi:RimJ/RimL family protein N-acetyltransferase